MGHIYTEITLSNPRDAGLKPMKVKALADSGAVTLCIPAHISNQLKLQTQEMREVTLADGRVMTVPYVGPIMVGFDNRTSFAGAFVMGDEALLGNIQKHEHTNTQFAVGVR